jgi:antitoxin component YwqK of YwqJK toxin-antitoxin module
MQRIIKPRENVVLVHDGRDTETTLVDGHLRRILKTWPNGQKRMDIRYNGMVPHGWMRTYDLNGCQIMKTQYRNGILHGFSKRFDKPVEMWFHKGSILPLGKISSQ